MADRRSYDAHEPKVDRMHTDRLRDGQQHGYGDKDDLGGRQERAEDQVQGDDKQDEQPPLGAMAEMASATLKGNLE